MANSVNGISAILVVVGVIHFGESAHGVLDISAGTRYCIVFFADLDDSDAAPGRLHRGRCLK